MLIEADDFDLSVGKGVGHILEDKIINAQERIWIVSPYFGSKDYADLLAEKTAEGVETRMVVAPGGDRRAERVFDLLYEEKTRVEKTSFFGLGIFTRRKKKPYMKRRIDDLRILRGKSGKWGEHRFLHSKIYVIDDEVAVGSANFSKSGFWENFESMIILKNSEHVSKFEDVFEKVRSHPMLEEQPVPKQFDPEKVEREIDSERLRNALMSLFEEPSEGIEGWKLVVLVLAVIIVFLLIASVAGGG